MARIEIKTKFTGPIWTTKGRLIMQQELRRAMTGLVATAETKVTEKTPVGATGSLRAGITGKVITHNLGRVVVVGPAAKYADVREQGRRPGGFPPVDAILLWVKRKLRPLNPKQVAFLVARKIARKGYVGAFMFKKAEVQMRRLVNATIRRAVARIERRLSK